MSGISYESWERELRDISPSDDEGLTVGELVEHFGMSRSTLIIHLKKMMKVGTCVEGHSVREDASGRIQRVRVYRLIDKGKKNRKKK